MERVEIILAGGTVVTMNDGFDVIPDGAVAIRDAKIVAVGTRAEVAAAYEADTVVDCAGQYIMPGLVNAHTHVPMTLLRGLADDLRLDVWLMGYMMPTEREFVNPEFCRVGTGLACAEMIRSGITCFADMYYYEAEVAAATAEAGLRGVLGQTILKFPSPDAETYEFSLDYAAQFIEKWRGHPLITPAVAPHAPYSTTDDILRECAQLAKAYDVPILIHIAETKLEVEDNVELHGMTVVPWVQSVGLLDAKVLAAHCVHINGGEMRILHDHHTTVAHCPTSNLKLAAGIAPVAQMLEHDLTVGIGTDGTASNNDLDMFEEVRLAAILAKTAANDPTALPARQALLMATRMGAEALFMGDITGSLEVGKLADVITVEANPVHNVPQFSRDPNAVYSRIVYAGKSGDVRHVICNGRWLMRDRQLLTIDEKTLLEQAEAYAVKIDRFLSAREEDILSKLLAIGGLEQSESFEVQVKASIPDGEVVQKLLKHPNVQVLAQHHYRQYDTYFLFQDDAKGRVRYREDDRIDERGEVVSVRTRLTYTLPTKEREFSQAILLSHSRFIAEADRPLRFFREYFQPEAERELQKDRRRWHIHYQGVLFYVNVDRILSPALPQIFIELKSRTWSKSDAENKADRIQEMLGILGVTQADIIREEYLEMQASP
ncbi:MAG: 5-methylthioadenosine/S-adenosylhomocysteine deaminase [Chloroflexota bacterium]|nr:MAG: 5-methylthioadenosine/S-adenosylhomocysteine deaminase [Chloroflexota bacterium]